MPDSRPILTPPPEETRDYLSYDPETGVFTWTNPLSDRCRAGSVAGWVAQGRRTLTVNKRDYKAGRLAWWFVHGEWPETEIDHINRDPLDNSIANLRVASRSQNLANRSARGQLGLKGVKTLYNSPKFMARIKVDNREKYLGVFDTPEEAAAAYDVAAVHYFGEFAYTNAQRAAA